MAPHASEAVVLVVAVSGIRIVPVVDAPWDDVRTVFGTRGDPARCWCQWFKADAASWKAPDAAAAFERSLCEQVDAARASRSPGPGVLAYLGDDAAGWAAVGWAAVEPRPAYTRLLTGQVIPATAEPELDRGDVWSITCFVVRVGFRRRGVGAALLQGAIAAAGDGGARVIEAYPVDTAGRKVSSADLYHGPLSTFEAAGFRVSGRPSDGRAVVQLTL